MAAPGVTVTTRSNVPGAGSVLDTATWFVAGTSEQGPTDEAVSFDNLAEFEARFGGRVSYSNLYDSVETFFREGGSRVVAARIVGPAPTKGTLTLKDGSAGAGLNTVRIDAADPGDFSTRVEVEVADGDGADTFEIIVRVDDVIRERSGDLASPTEAVTWGSFARWVRVVDLASATAAPDNNPRVLASTALSAGAGDHAAATDTQREAALALFDRDLGPGQVSIPGATTATIHEALVEHAASHNRVAILDAPDTATVADLVTAADAVTALDDARRAAMFGPPVTIPGLTTGTTRTVPASALAAGLIARGDRAAGTITPPAGANGVTRYVNGVARNFSETDRGTLNDAGFNVVRSMLGNVRLYGFRTLSDDLRWRSLAEARLAMEIENRALLIGEEFNFVVLDPRGRSMSGFGGALAGMLTEYYNAGALYGDSPDEAFEVNIGEQVNTPTTIAAGELRAVIEVKMSPFAERVSIEIIKVAVGEPVG